MQVKSIPASTLSAATIMLSPYTGGDLTPPTLVAALRQYEGGPSTEVPVFLDKHAAARALGVSTFTVIRMVKDGTLRGCKVRGQWRIPADAIRAMAEGEG